MNVLVRSATTNSVSGDQLLIFLGHNINGTLCPENNYNRVQFSGQSILLITKICMGGEKPETHLDISLSEYNRKHKSLLLHTYSEEKGANSCPHK